MMFSNLGLSFCETLPLKEQFYKKSTRTLNFYDDYELKIFQSVLLAFNSAVYLTPQKRFQILNFLGPNFRAQNSLDF